MAQLLSIFDLYSILWRSSSSQFVPQRLSVFPALYFLPGLRRRFSEDGPRIRWYVCTYVLFRHSYSWIHDPERLIPTPLNSPHEGKKTSKLEDCCCWNILSLTRAPWTISTFASEDSRTLCTKVSWHWMISWGYFFVILLTSRPSWVFDHRWKKRKNKKRKKGSSFSLYMYVCISPSRSRTWGL